MSFSPIIWGWRERENEIRGVGEVKVLIETVPTTRQTQSIKDESTRFILVTSVGFDRFF